MLPNESANDVVRVLLQRLLPTMTRLIQRIFLPLLLAVGFGAGAVQAQSAAQQLPDFADLVERSGPAVVNIRTTARLSSVHGRGGAPQIPGLDENDPFYEFFRRFFPQPQPGQPQPRPGPRGDRQIPRGLGSGFIISADGYLMTNHHVVEGSEQITVTLADKREFSAKLIGSDQRTDVALLKIDASGLPSVRIGDPNRLRVGEWVIAIGSPFGLESTVTAGIVSAKARDTGEFLPFIQTDVAVNPGNSGGPLINLRGEVVGINSQIFTTSGAFAGISFAIPIDEAMRVQEQLRASGRVVRGRIGVTIGTVSREVAEAIGLGKPQGALVTAVDPEGPAAKAGIEAGDVVLRFDGRSIDSQSDLPRIVGGTKPGSKVSMNVWRKGTARDVQVTVAEMAQEPQAARRGETPPRTPAPTNALGLTVSDLPAEKLKEIGVRGAVQVDAVDGPAASAGLRQGDLILSVNNIDVTSAKQFNEQVAKLDRKRNVALLVRRGDSTQFVIVRPAER
jgi:serine protease Do